MSGTTRAKPGFANTVITPWGPETYQVFLRREDQVWIANIVTLPNRVWAMPGAREAVKFHGKTAEEAEAAAVEFMEAERIATNRRLWRPGDDSHHAEPRVRVGPALLPQPANRYPVKLLLRFGENGPTLPGLTANISESGLFVITDKPSPLGGHVEIDLRFPDRPMSLWGEVVWISERKLAGGNVGFGARLLQKPLDYTVRIRKLRSK